MQMDEIQRHAGICTPGSLSKPRSTGIYVVWATLSESNREYESLVANFVVGGRYPWRTDCRASAAGKRVYIVSENLGWQAELCNAHDDSLPRWPQTRGIGAL